MVHTKLHRHSLSLGISSSSRRLRLPGKRSPKRCEPIALTSYARLTILAEQPCLCGNRWMHVVLMCCLACDARGGGGTSEALPTRQSSASLPRSSTTSMHKHSHNWTSSEFLEPYDRVAQRHCAGCFEARPKHATGDSITSHPTQLSPLCHVMVAQLLSSSFCTTV